MEEIVLYTKEGPESSVLKKSLKATGTNVKRSTPENPGEMNRFQDKSEIWKAPRKSEILSTVVGSGSFGFALLVCVSFFPWHSEGSGNYRISPRVQLRPQGRVIRSGWPEDPKGLTQSFLQGFHMCSQGSGSPLGYVAAGMLAGGGCSYFLA